MKKTSFTLLITIALLLLGLSSCKNTSSEVNSPRAQKDLLYTLREFNTSQKDNMLKGPNELRGFWEGVGDFFIVAGADIVGAGAGASAVQGAATAIGVATSGIGYLVTTGGAAIVCGTGASYASYKELVKQDSTSNNGNNNNKDKSKHLYRPVIANLNIKYPSYFSSLKRVGAEHNRLVSRLLNGEIRSFGDLIIAENIETVNDEELKKYSADIEATVIENGKNGGNTSTLVEKLSQKGYFNGVEKEVLLLFFDIYEKTRNFDHIEDVINFYMETITSAKSLSEKEKTVLVNALSVASETPYFWTYGKEK